MFSSESSTVFHFMFRSITSRVGFLCIIWGRDRGSFFSCMDVQFIQQHLYNDCFFSYCTATWFLSSSVSIYLQVCFWATYFYSIGLFVYDYANTTLTLTLYYALIVHIISPPAPLCYFKTDSALLFLVLCMSHAFWISMSIYSHTHTHTPLLKFCLKFLNVWILWVVAC